MNPILLSHIEQFSAESIPADRKALLQPLIAFIQAKRDNSELVRLNFICTHNSRRSHFAQVWAQALAHYFELDAVFCYSGGTVATEVFPKTIETLLNQGFDVQKLAESGNPIYVLKYDEDALPITCFSKVYDDYFNPKSNFAAVLTCDSAAEACPIVRGASARFSVQYDDPKAFDGHPAQESKYAECSLAIGQEMWFVFSKIKTN